MITDYFTDLNWLAILVATIAWFAFSAIWYSVPAMSKAWQKAARVDPSEGGSFAKALVTSFICYLVTATAVALIAIGIGSTTVTDGLTLGLVLGVGFGVASALVAQVYENKGGSYWLINGVNSIAAMVIVSVIVSVWR